MEAEEKTLRQLAQGLAPCLLALGGRWAGRARHCQEGDPGLWAAQSSQIRPDNSKKIATDPDFPTAGQQAAWAMVGPERRQDSPAL